MIKTFLDTGVLIAGARGNHHLGYAYYKIVDEPDRVYCSTPYLRLEAYPIPIFRNNQDEKDILDSYFENVTEWYNDYDGLMATAWDLGERYGLAGIDALHAAAGVIMKIDEFFTTEGHGSSFFLIQEFKVINLQDYGEGVCKGIKG